MNAYVAKQLKASTRKVNVDLVSVSFSLLQPHPNNILASIGIPLQNITRTEHIILIVQLSSVCFSRASHFDDYFLFDNDDSHVCFSIRSGCFALLCGFYRFKESRKQLARAMQSHILTVFTHNKQENFNMFGSICVGHR